MIYYDECANIGAFLLLCLIYIYIIIVVVVIIIICDPAIELIELHNMLYKSKVPILELFELMP